MKRFAAVLGFAALMSVGTAHAENVDVLISVNPDNLSESYVVHADRGVDSQIMRVLIGPIVACAMDLSPEGACIPVLPGETLAIRSGGLVALPTAEAGQCWKDPVLDAMSPGSRMFCTE